MSDEVESNTFTYEGWIAKGRELFGTDTTRWRFVCPACGHVASVRDWKDAGAPETAVGFSCVGRWLANARDAFVKGTGPCNYAGGGLFRLNPVSITMPNGSVEHAFAFADPAPGGSHE